MNIIPEVVKQSALSVGNKLEIDIQSLDVLATQVSGMSNFEEPLFTDGDDGEVYLSADCEKIMEQLSILAKKNDYISLGIASIDGYHLDTTNNFTDISGTGAFITAVSGTSTASEPTVRDGNLTLAFAVPVLSENNEVLAVLTGRRSASDVLSIINDVQLLETGSATIIDRDGVTLADKDMSLVADEVNFIDVAKENSDYESLANAITTMIEGTDGVTEYTYNGEDKIMVYDKIPGTDDWTIGIAVQESEMYHHVIRMNIIALMIGISSIIISVIFAIIFGKNMTQPIKALVEIIKKVGKGDFTTKVDQRLIDRKDELGIIAESIEELKASMNTMISEVKENGETIAETSNKLVEEFEEVSISAQNINLAISEVAEGNGKQSQDITDISIQTENFTDQLNTLSDYISNVKNNTIKIENNTESSKEIVDNLENSIDKFDKEFVTFNKEIKKLGDDMSTVTSITSMINDISEQTELLALNAAIEAARAGEAGKGFAVVADEIRLLAEQSKTNADQITKIIDESYNNSQAIVEKANYITKELDEQNKNIANVRNVVGNIVESVEEVLPEIEKVYEEIGTVKESQASILSNISNVSAISEEVSASSEEILATSNELDEKSRSSSNISKELDSVVGSIMEKLEEFKVENKTQNEKTQDEDDLISKLYKSKNNG